MTTNGSGTYSITAASSFATSAQGTKADSAVQPAAISNMVETTDSIDVLADVDTTTAAPTSGQVLIWNGSNWAPGNAAAAGLEFDSQIKTASFSAAINTGYFVNTASGVLTVTLPSSPSVGDEVHVIDSSNSAATNNITIGRNGNPIASSASDLTVAVNGAAFRLIYSGSSTFGWVLMNK